MYSIEACLLCGETKRTIVSKYNRLIFLDSMWQNDLARFDYALCHGCGLVYATRRPDRAEYDFLYERFSEFLVRRNDPNSMNVHELTPQRAAEIDAQFVPWWEVHTAPGRGKIRKRLLNDLKDTLRYVPDFAPHVQMKGAKVLHIRAKTSTLADYLKRVLGAAQADVMTLFPTHAYLAEKNAGIRAKTCVDYEDFSIPFEDQYDLIIDNHVLVHMMDPNKTFEVFRSHLEPGGSIFLHKELDDDNLCKGHKNLFAELRPFHYHQFDIPTLKRMLHRFGFETKYLTNIDEGEPELIGIAKMVHEPTACPRIGAKELRDRLDMYARWRDESILCLPKERCQALFGSELEDVWRRVRRSGGLKRRGNGKASAYRRFREGTTSDEQMEIWPALRRKRNGVRAQVQGWVANRLRGTRTADWLARNLRGTRGGEWIERRVMNPAPPGQHVAAK